MKTCTEVLQQKETDEFNAVGINVASKLRKMNPTQQVLAEGLINKILMKGIFEELTRTTDISDISVFSSSNLYDHSSRATASTSIPSPLTSAETVTDSAGITLQYYTNVGKSFERQSF